MRFIKCTSVFVNYRIFNKKRSVELCGFYGLLGCKINNISLSQYEWIIQYEALKKNNSNNKEVSYHKAESP